MKSLLKYGLAIAVLSIALSFGQAAFASPESIQGTTWKGRSSNNQPVRVTINDQQPLNPAQESVCYSVSGEMDVDTRTGKLDGTMTGFYCPKGTFAFLLRRKEDREPMQVYQGKISNDGKSMKGTMLYLSGDWGEYPFSAKQ
jgi:hypothetical protein